MNHDLTVPLTEPVPTGEALLLDQFRSSTGLTEHERHGVETLVTDGLTTLLERLPCGTPERLIDRICDLLSDIGNLLSDDTGPISCVQRLTEAI